MSNNTQPEIRFPGFTEDWEERKLNELAEFNPKSDLPERFEYVDLESVVGTELVGHRTENRYSAPSRAQRLAKKNDVFYQTVRPYQKNNYLFDLPYDNYVFSTGYAQMRPIGNGYFLLTLIQEEKFVNRVLERSTGTSYPAINSNDLAKLPVKVPADIQEQQKVGTFFKQIDNTITLHQRKLDLLKETKKGFLQKMFPKNGAKVPEIRFPGFTEDWEQRRLSDVASIVGGGTPSTSNPEYWDGDIDWYAPAEIGDQIYVSKSLKTITELGQQKSSAKILPIGTVLFTSRAGIGNTAILAKEGTTNQGFQSIVPHKNKLDSYFIFSRTHELKRYGEVTGAGSTFAEVSGKQMAKMPILIPCINEQRKIGAFFEQLDTTITLHQRELDVLKETKKGFLQKMFV
ncbi:restriction endonuclease subunit S [Enterococcus faecium]|uniref:restriction endonuclease subunit S n=1 Tax=Enterococcus faecium TaxID=1352 RepID=UPI000CF252FE|nr:restriction endonuclease subunit S [Enterococcus faecium]PQF45899.1 restriction endonuclease subunit S [Enterococcus faecium]